MPLRHDPSDEALFDAVVRTGGDPARLAAVGAEAARAIRRRQARTRLLYALMGVAVGGTFGLILLLGD